MMDRDNKAVRCVKAVADVRYSAAAVEGALPGAGGRVTFARKS